MKKCLGVALAVAAMAVPASAMGDPGGGQSATNSCFGQGRSAYATSNPPGAVGAAASYRKGDNAAINAAYKESCGA